MAVIVELLGVEKNAACVDESLTVGMKRPLLTMARLNLYYNTVTLDIRLVSIHH